MPRANGEIVLAFLQAINRRDWDAAFTDAAPDFAFDVSRAIGPYRGVYGVDDARQLFEEFADSWQSLRIEPDDYIESDDCIVVTSTMHLEGRDGIAVSSTVAWVWTIRDEQLARATMFQERDEALRAVGLEP